MEKDIIKEFEENIREVLERIILNSGYDTAWFNQERTELINGNRTDGFIYEVLKLFKSAVSQAKEEGRKQGVEAFIKKETEYWKNVFDTRPYDRDLESDTIAQNFARIEIERLKKLIN